MSSSNARKNISSASEPLEYGGLFVNYLGRAWPSHEVLADGAYHYSLYRLAAGERAEVKGLKSYSIYVYRVTDGARVKVSGAKKFELSEGDAVDARAMEVTLSVSGGEAMVLVAGSRKFQDSPAGLRAMKASEIKKVIKPWGHELWINGEGGAYSLKHIFIKAGNKTSLQYHRVKSETTLLVSGEAALHYKGNPKASNDSVTPADLKTAPLIAGQYMNVATNVLHRIQALTDIHVCETSTPELDDVVRVSDDAKRPDGRIDSEHAKSAAPVVCILTAGRGSRMGELCHSLNKALLPLGKKAAISHIVEKFPSSSEFVIALGHLGGQVKTYLEMAHPERKFSFVQVDHFEGAGSGPGRSLLACAPLLQRPFYYVSCDTLWDEGFEFQPDAGTWLGVAKVPASESASYCNFEVSDGNVRAIKDKQRVDGEAYRAFVGMGHIRDFAPFFAALVKPRLVADEHQVSSGFEALLGKGLVKAREISWTDLGDESKYRRAAAKYESYDFSKAEEALYIVNGRVIKFFADAKLAENRIERARMNPKVFPPIKASEKQFYCYEFVPGATLYRHANASLLKKLLGWLDTNLWLPVKADPALVKKTCEDFYRVKTEKRLAAYFKKYDVKDGPTTVNGRALPSTQSLFEKMPWDRLFDGKSVFFHGDLHFDNMVYDRAGERFTLLDWRQDFGGRTDFGDIYYDLAKFHGGLILNYDHVKSNLFDFQEAKPGVIDIDFAQNFSSAPYAKIFREFVEFKGYDFGKVKLLTGLIYLNMAPLHQAPFDKFLYSLGRLMLDDELNARR